LNLNQLDITLQDKILKNCKITIQEKRQVKTIKKIYGNSIVNIKGNSLSEKKIRYLIEKIKLIPIITVDVRYLKVKREKIELICGEYDFIEIVDNRIRHKR